MLGLKSMGEGPFDGPSLDSSHEWNLEMQVSLFLLFILIRQWRTDKPTNNR
jgi:hypothetical protein